MSFCRDKEELLIKEIANLPEDASCEHVAQALDPIVTCIENDIVVSPKNESGATTSSSITPLMIACDKSQAETVRYLADCYCSKSSLRTAIGGPLDASPAGGGNTAVHYAALAGKWVILEDLCRMMLVDDVANSDAHPETAEPLTKAQEGNRERLLCRVAELRNAHGDTPIMMACFSGHTKFVRRWLQLILDKGDREKLQEVLVLRNESSHSALSLSCGHGQVSIVQLLVQGPNHNAVINKQCWPCPATWEDLAIGEKTLQKMNELQQKQQSVTEQFKKKRKEVEQCVDLVREALSNKADELAAELLGGEATPSKENVSTRKVLSKKRRSKSKPRGNVVDPVIRINGDNNSLSKSDEKGGAETLGFTQLEDGTRAVVVQGMPDVHQSTNSVAGPQGPNRKSADELFRKRFTEDIEIDDIMNALCLDVSMLLLTPHGMALNLSASQLDAIEQILEKQRHSIQHARAIQARLHEINRQLNNNDDASSSR